VKHLSPRQWAKENEKLFSKNKRELDRTADPGCLVLMVKYAYGAEINYLDAWRLSGEEEDFRCASHWHDQFLSAAKTIFPKSKVLSDEGGKRPSRKILRPLEWAIENEKMFQFCRHDFDKKGDPGSFVLMVTYAYGAEINYLDAWRKANASGRNQDAIKYRERAEHWNTEGRESALRIFPESKVLM